MMIESCRDQRKMERVFLYQHLKRALSQEDTLCMCPEVETCDAMEKLDIRSEPLDQKENLVHCCDFSTITSAYDQTLGCSIVSCRAGDVKTGPCLLDSTAAILGERSIDL